MTNVTCPTSKNQLCSFRVYDKEGRLPEMIADYDDAKANAAAGTSSGSLPFLTIAICTRDRVQFLREAIESVLRQMRPGIEFLIVDNGSTDETPDLLREFSRQNHFIRVHTEREAGVSRARNAALREARGKYVLFLDDDDIAEEGWLDAYFKFLNNLPVPRLAGAGGAVIPRFESPVPRWLAPGLNTLNWSEKPQRFKMVGGPWNCSLALDRAVALAVGGYDQQLGRKGNGMSSHEESAIFAKIQAAGYAFWWLPHARIRYRVHGERIKFWFVSRSEFASGISAAICKASLRPAGFRRWGWCICRALAAPWQVLGGTLAVPFLLVFCPLHRAANSWFRACRNAGFFTGLWTLLSAKK